MLRDPRLDAAFKELLLSLPSEAYIAEQLAVVSPPLIHAARRALRLQLAQALRDDWAWAFDAHRTPGGYSPVARASRTRSGAGASARSYTVSPRLLVILVKA